jgi:hypothetical protein
VRALAKKLEGLNWRQIRTIEDSAKLLLGL